MCQGCDQEEWGEGRQRAKRKGMDGQSRSLLEILVIAGGRVPNERQNQSSCDGHLRGDSISCALVKPDLTLSLPGQVMLFVRYDGKHRPEDNHRDGHRHLSDRVGRETQLGRESNPFIGKR